MKTTVARDYALDMKLFLQDAAISSKRNRRNFVQLLSTFYSLFYNILLYLLKIYWKKYSTFTGIKNASVCTNYQENSSNINMFK